MKKHFVVLFFVVLLSSTYVYSQNTDKKIVIEPIEPSETSTTWVDSLYVKNSVNLTLPPNIPKNGLETVKTVESIYLLARRVRIVAKDESGSIKLQIIYIPASSLPTSISLPQTGVIDIGSPFQNKTYEIDCKNDGVSVIPSPPAASAAVSAVELTFLKRECSEIERNKLKKGIFNGMGINERKTFTTDEKRPMFMEELVNFSVRSWDIKLRETNDDLSEGKFDVSIETDNSSSINKAFPTFVGVLKMNKTASSIDLNLKGIAKEVSQALPDGSQIKSNAEIIIAYKRSIF